MRDDELEGSGERVASGGRPVAEARGSLAGLGLLALCIMLPVTLPVPVLREIVQGRFDVSELATSVFMSINMLGAFLVAPAAGALMDRIGRPRILIVAALGLDALCFLALGAPIPFALFLAIRFVEGCAHITALSILLTLASQALPAASRGRAMGVVGACMMLGIALGAPLGGFLGRSDPALPLQVAGLLALAAAALAAAVVRGSAVSEARPALRDIAAALGQEPALLVPLAFAFADRFTVGFFTTTFSLYAGRIHGMAPAEIGISIAIFMIPFAAFSYPFGRLADRYSLALLVGGGSLLYGLGTATVGFAAPPLLNAVMFGIGITAAVMFVPSMVMTTELAPEQTRATAMGAFNAAGSLGFILGPLTGGAISQLVAHSSGWLAGYRAAFLTAGLSELLCVALALPFLLRLRRQRRIS